MKPEIQKMENFINIGQLKHFVETIKLSRNERENWRQSQCKLKYRIMLVRGPVQALLKGKYYIECDLPPSIPMLLAPTGPFRRRAQYGLVK